MTPTFAKLLLESKATEYNESYYSETVFLGGINRSLGEFQKV